MKKAIILIAVILTLVATFAACDEYPDKRPVIPEGSGGGSLLPDGGNDLDEYVYYEAVKGYEYSQTSRISYYSELAGGEKHATVTLPASYHKSNQTYPVLYLLHGLKGNEYSWKNDMGSTYIVQNAHYFDGASEMIVVGVNCIVNAGEKEPGMFTETLTEVYDKTGQDVVENLMPYINENYNVKTGKENTAIAGYSMGGREALLTAFAYQDAFGYIGAFSSANFGKNVASVNAPIPDFKLDDGNEDGFKYILMNVGSAESFTGTYDTTPAISAVLAKNGIAHKWYVVNGGMHAPPVWRNGLNEFVKHLFL